MHPTSLKLTALCKLAARQKWYNELNSTMVITGFDTKTGLFGVLPEHRWRSRGMVHLNWSL